VHQLQLRLLQVKDAHQWNMREQTKAMAAADSIEDLFTEEDCCWKWDVPVDESFAPGKDIGYMTYAEMYAKVNEWHTKVAGEPLCVHCRMPRAAKPGSAPHIVQFYCIIFASTFHQQAEQRASFQRFIC
jgi:hypothetical protein